MQKCEAFLCLIFSNLKNNCKIFLQMFCSIVKVMYICQTKHKGNMKTQIEIKKLNLVEVPTEFQKEEGCIAFQMVELSYSFYGSLMTERFDTKILPNGKQLVINGNGFIKDNFEIN